jgi:hypothetical protein
MPRPPIDADTRRHWIGIGFAFAIVAAPFLALLYGRQFGIGMMAVTLGTTSFLAFDARGQAGPEMRRRLELLSGLNLLLAIGMVALFFAIR